MTALSQVVVSVRVVAKCGDLSQCIGCGCRLPVDSQQRFDPLDLGVSRVDPAELFQRCTCRINRTAAQFQFRLHGKSTGVTRSDP